MTDLSNNISKLDRIHFVGIGGIGMSGIAEFLHLTGYLISGSDIAINSKNVQRLQDLGIEICALHSAENIANTTLVVVSSAIDLNTNPEVLAAQDKSIRVIKRSKMLGYIMAMKSCITVAGTHGKTTTTSLIGSLLEGYMVYPTIISGGIMNSYSSNILFGTGDWIVAEADESDGSFIDLPADIAIVTNIEMEHQSYYNNTTQLIATFTAFLNNIPETGLCILCGHDNNIQNVITNINCKNCLTYGIASNEYDIEAHNIKFTTNHMHHGMTFDVTFRGSALKYLGERSAQHITGIFLPTIYGNHNVLNSLAAVAVAVALQLDINMLSKSFRTFTGVKRRFTILQQGIQSDNINKTITIIDDYAHHPTEIASTLNAALMHQQHLHSTCRTIAIIEPHRYTRLSALLDDFAQTLKVFDKVIVTPVYSAGEVSIHAIDSTTLVTLINAMDGNALYCTTIAELKEHLCTTTLQYDELIFMGAGSITSWAYDILEFFTNSTSDSAHSSFFPLHNGIERCHT